MKTSKLISLGVALTLGVSAIAANADASCRRARHHAAAGTAVGAIAGGLIGNSVAHGGGRLGGTLIGAGAGAVVGHQVGKHSVKCGPTRHRRHHR